MEARHGTSHTWCWCFYCGAGPVTYCVLLKGYGRQRRLRGVEATMREIKAKGVVLDVVALNAAVDAFVR